MKRTIAFFCIAFAPLALVSFAQVPLDVARVEQVVASHKDFMGTILVARGNDVLFSKGYGSADLEWAIPNTPTVKFRLGSVTKQFTAASILLLEERGKLNINDPIKKYMPDAPAAWDKVTIYNLLNHTSGIPSFTGFPDYSQTEPFATSPAKLVARFKDKPLEFQPGEKWNYSNSGYVLLGYLLEKISGQTYIEFLQQNIFKPLAMVDTGYDSNSAVILHRASGYVPSPDGPQNAGFIHMSIPFSAGALYSTTEDLLRWEQGLFGGKILSAASLQKMTTPFKNDYALGVASETQKGRQRISHGGGIEGFNTFLAYYPSSKITVVVLSNINGSDPDDIAAKLGALAHGDKVVLASERKETQIAPKIMADYTGAYTFSGDFAMNVTFENGQLLSQLPGQPKIQIFPESDTLFFTKGIDAEVEFFRDDKGKPSYLILHQGGRDQKAMRTGDVVAKPERKEVAVSPKLLAEYVGTYQLAPNFDIVVTLEGNQLMTQATGQGKVPVFAESDTKFFLKVVDAQIEFFRNDKGQISYLMLHQGGRDMKAERQ